jgi:hypothetical protein
MKKQKYWMVMGFGVKSVMETSFTSLLDAINHAILMAESHKGYTFMVFETVCSYCVDTPVNRTDYE